MTSAAIARRFLGALEPIVAMIYFVPEAAEEYAALGIDPAPGYFYSRSAPMGRVAPSVVASAFFNFNPAIVTALLDWSKQDPAAVLAARDRAVRRALERLLADEDGSLPDVSQAAEMLREAATACRPEGRTMFAAHASLPWPEDPLVSLWQGANLLREFRGDGHIAALITHQVDAVEALVLHTRYMEVKPDFLYATRVWGDEAYAAAVKRLAERNFLTPEGEITDGGRKFRDMIEMETDHLASLPYEALGPDRCEVLHELVYPLAERIVQRKGVPSSLGRIAQVFPQAFPQA